MLGAIPYTGNKQSLLKDIIPLFPKYKRFVDCFCGGLSVSLNVDGIVISNDIQKELIDMYESMKTKDFNELIRLKEQYNLSDTNKEAYLRLRDEYNNSKNPILLFLLVQHSFSNMIRFHNDKFNSPFGKRTFTRNTEKRWNNFQSKELIFSSKHYSMLDIKQDDFVYCDPPYLITQASYNAFWDDVEEVRLLSWLDSLNARGIKFCLSNVIYHRGLQNNILIDWMKSYDVTYLDKNYIFNQHHSDKKNTVEVLIRNYK